MPHLMSRLERFHCTLTAVSNLLCITDSLCFTTVLFLLCVVLQKALELGLKSFQVKLKGTGPGRKVCKYSTDFLCFVLCISCAIFRAAITEGTGDGRDQYYHLSGRDPSAPQWVQAEKSKTFVECSFISANRRMRFISVGNTHARVRDVIASVSI